MRGLPLYSSRNPPNDLDDERVGVRGPVSVTAADWKNLNPSIGRTDRSMILRNYLVEIFDLTDLAKLLVR